MFLSDFSVKRPIATIVIIIVLMTMGLLALSKLRVNEIPNVQQPILNVYIPYPGASPESSEREILERIEKSLQSISGVDDLNASATEGAAQFTIIFNFDKNMIEATEEVRNAIASVRYKLPVEMREPIIQRLDPNDQPIIQIALSSKTLSHAQISRMAEDDLSNRFRGVDGVSTVNVDGALKRELSVLLRSEKLREYNISVSEVVNAVRAQNATAPVGKVRGEMSEKSIRLIGRIDKPEEFENIVVKRRGNEVIRLAQVAEVRDGFAEVSSFSLRNANPNVGMTIRRSREASTVSVANEVRKKVAEINKNLPEGTELTITQDGGKNAQKNLNNVVEALILGAGLTIFVVYVFLNSWRSTVITALSLPTSVIAAFIAVWLCGFTLNFMTLLGLSLAIGVLIDDAIVVRENIVRHMEMGEDRRTASLRGTAEIGLAVAATTFSIMAVFIPVAFMPGVSGEWFRPFALTVTTSVMVSLFISFTLDPMLSAFWGDPPGYQHAKKTGLSLKLQQFNEWFDHQADKYGKVIAWALHHRKWMFGIALFTFAIALALHINFGKSDFLPKADNGFVIINIRTPSSSSLEYSKLKVEKAAEFARTLKEVVATNSTVNPTGGRVYVDIGKSTERQRSAAQIAVEIRKMVSELTGAEYVVQDDISMGGSKPVQIRFYGEDSRKLTEITNDFMSKMRQIKGAVDVGLSQQDPKDELKIELNRGLAANLGVSVNDAAQSLRVAFAGIEAGDWVDPTGETRDVAIRLHPSDKMSAENIERLPISVAGTDKMIPLEQIASITMGKGPARIDHSNGKRVITVSANVQNRSSGEVTTDALKLAKSINFPEGYGIELSGNTKSQQRLFMDMTVALLSGIALMYLILVMQFNSFSAPLGVMASLPLSLIGVVLAFMLTGSSLNLMSFIGIIMLMGLVAKNAILLLDCARANQKEGMDREDALMKAGRMRFRPILMTTFALIAGMIPVAIGVGEGGEFYRPLAIAIIGGTITSTLLTLLVVPSFYDGIEIYKDKLSEKLKTRVEKNGTLLGFIMNVLEVLCILLLILIIVVVIVGGAIFLFKLIGNLL